MGTTEQQATEILDRLFAALEHITTQLEELREQQEELVEKVVNLSLPGRDYDEEY